MIKIFPRGKVFNRFWKERSKDTVGDIFIEILPIKSSNDYVYEVRGLPQDMLK